MFLPAGNVAFLFAFLLGFLTMVFNKRAVIDRLLMVAHAGGVRKVKFAPKIPAARKRATQVKEEGADDALHQSIYAAAKVRA
jgi:hypothetical protein